MTRRERLRQLASQRREFAADALRCEASAALAGEPHVGSADVWLDRADGWWKLVAEVAKEYERLRHVSENRLQIFRPADCRA